MTSKIYIAYKFYILLFILFISQISFATNNIVLRSRVYAKNGFVDLVDKNWKKKVYGLYGEWKFYWKELLSPENINKQNKKAIPVKVPNTWTEYTINGEKLPKFGYATYHLKIKVPEHIKTVGLSFQGVFTAYRLWVNGKFIDENGKIGKDETSSKPSLVPKTYYIQVENNELDLVIQVSNFQHFKGGLLRQIIIGKAEVIEKYNIFNVGLEAALMGSLLIFALFFLFIFSSRKEDLSAIYFVITLLSQAIITGLDGEYILFRLVPNLNWFFALHLLWFLSFYRTITFIYYIYSLIPKEFNIKILIFLTVYASAFGLFSIFAPIHSLKILLYGYPILALLSLLYIFFILLKSIKYQIGAVYTLIGIIILMSTGINDLLYDFNYISTFYMIGYGLVIFIFTLSMIMVMSHAKAERVILINSLMLKNLDKIRDSLLKIPFYDIGKALKILTNHLKFQRGIWIEKNKELTIKHETKLNKVKEINLKFNQIDNNFLYKNAIIETDKNKKIFIYPLTKKQRKKIAQKTVSNDDLFKYIISKKIKGIISFPLLSDKQVKAIVYFENNFNFINSLQIKLLIHLYSQFIGFYQNATNFNKLREANINLNSLVEERGKLLKEKEKKLKEKGKVLNEKIEELRTYNEELKAINIQLEQNRAEIEIKNRELEKLHNEILKQKMLAEKQYQIYKQSLKFAKNTLSFTLQVDKILPFKDYFIIYQPKFEVGGDFYLIKNFGEKTVIAVADSTGHGIPGAFMTILANMHLTNLLQKYFYNQNSQIINPGQILNKLRDLIINSLTTNSKNNKYILKDGLDIGLAIIDNKTLKLDFSGSYIPMWIIREKNLIQLKANRFPIGLYIKAHNKDFTYTTFQLTKDDRIYLFTDGYTDQFNSLGEKFYKKNLRKLLLEIANYPTSLQKEILYNTFIEWKGQTPQTDDILVLGIII